MNAQNKTARHNRQNLIYKRLRLFLSLLIALAPLNQALSATLDEVLREYEAGKGAKDFVVEKDQKVSGATKTQHLIKALTASGEVVEIKILYPISAQEVNSLNESDRKILRAAFAPQQTPYMGDIAQFISKCPQRFGPKEREVQIRNGKMKVSILFGTTSSDFTFGACSDEKAKFTGAHFAYFEESTKRGWFWRVYEPLKAPQKSLQSERLEKVIRKIDL